MGGGGGGGRCVSASVGRQPDRHSVATSRQRGMNEWMCAGMCVYVCMLFKRDEE